MRQLIRLIFPCFACVMLVPNASAAALDFSPVLDRVADGTRVVIVGEIHGTSETPEAFGQLVTQDAARLGGVTVALEFPPAGDAYSGFLAGDADRGRILELPFWSKVADGRQSVAMLELLRHLRQLRAEGADVALQAFDSRQGYSGQGDAALAESLRAIIDEVAPRPVLVLTGNLHARRRAGTPFNPEFRPMAHRLDSLSLLSLDARFDGGRAWMCQPGKKCGPHPVGTQFRDGVPGEPGVFLFDELDERGFDGMIYVGSVTASPPARQSAQ